MLPRKIYNKVDRELLDRLIWHSTMGSIRRDGGMANEFIEQMSTDECPRIFYILTHEWEYHGLDKDWLKMLWISYVESKEKPIPDESYIVKVIDTYYLDRYNYEIGKHDEEDHHPLECVFIDLTKVKDIETIDSRLLIYFDLRHWKSLGCTYNLSVSAWRNTKAGEDIGDIDYNDFIVVEEPVYDVIEFPISYFKVNDVFYASYDDIFLKFNWSNGVEECFGIHIFPQLIN